MNLFKRRMLHKIHYFLIIVTIVTLFLSISLKGLSRPVTSFQVDGKPYLKGFFTLGDPSPLDVAWKGGIDDVISVKNTRNILIIPKGNNSIIILNISMNSSASFKSGYIIFSVPNVNLAQYPWLQVEVKAPSILGYGIRFLTGQKIIYTEPSSIEHLHADKSIRMNIQSYTRNFGVNLTNLDGICFYVEGSAELEGTFQVIIHNLKIFNLREIILPFDRPLKGEFKHIILFFDKIPYLESLNLTLTRIQVTFDVKGTDDLTYMPSMTVRLPAQVNLPYQRSYGLTYAARTWFLFEVAVVHDFTRREYLAQPEYPVESDLFCSFDADQGYFQEFNLHTVTLFFTSQPFVTDIILNIDFRVYILLYLVAIFLIPISIMLLVAELFYNKPQVSKRTLISVVNLGVFIRLCVAPFTGGWDLGQWSFWTRNYFESGQLNPLHFPVLPLLYWILIASTSYYHLLRTFGISDSVFILHSNCMLEAIFLKLPFILADVLTSLIIFYFPSTKKEGQKLVYMSAYLFNPFSIYVSSALGTYDSIMLAFLCLGFYYMSKKSDTKSSVVLVLGGILKILPFFTFFISLVLELMKRDWRVVLKRVFIASILLIMVILPLGFNLQILYESLLLRLLGLSGASESLTTLVSTVFNWRNTVVTESLLFFILAILFVVAGYLLNKKSSLDLQLIIKTMLMVTVAIYLLQVGVSGHWYLWMIPLLILLSCLDENNLVSYSYLLGIFLFFLTSIHFHGFGLIITGEPYNLTALEYFPKIIGYLNAFLAIVLTAFLILLNRRIKNEPQLLINISLIYLIFYLFTIFIYG